MANRCCIAPTRQNSGRCTNGPACSNGCGETSSIRSKNARSASSINPHTELGTVVATQRRERSERCQALELARTQRRIGNSRSESNGASEASAGGRGGGGRRGQTRRKERR